MFTTRSVTIMNQAKDKAFFLLNNNNAVITAIQPTQYCQRILQLLPCKYIILAPLSANAAMNLFWYFCYIEF